MVTPARPTVLADCILLEAEGHTMKLEAKSDVSLDYMTWDKYVCVHGTADG